MHFQLFYYRRPLPLSPNDVDLVKGLEEGVVRKCEPVTTSEDGLDELVVVSRLIHPEFERHIHRLLRRVLLWQWDPFSSHLRL